MHPLHPPPKSHPEKDILPQHVLSTLTMHQPVKRRRGLIPTPPIVSKTIAYRGGGGTFHCAKFEKTNLGNVNIWLFLLDVRGNFGFFWREALNNTFEVIKNQLNP